MVDDHFVVDIPDLTTLLGQISGNDPVVRGLAPEETAGNKHAESETP